MIEIEGLLRGEPKLLDSLPDWEARKQIVGEKLTSLARERGESIAPREIDNAIDQYFALIRPLSTPVGSGAQLLANLYIARGKVVGIVMGVLVLVALMWVMNH